MIHDSIRRTPHPRDIPGLSTQALRDTFQISHLFVPGELTAHFTDLDRLVVGGVMPPQHSRASTRTKHEAQAPSTRP